MSTTTNYNLQLTDANETSLTFLQWRTLMNGVNTDSNMELIDSAMHGIAESVGAAGDSINALSANFTGEYENTTYAVGDYVIYDGALYRCVTAIDTAEAWTSSKWVQVSVTGETEYLRKALRGADGAEIGRLFIPCEDWEYLRYSPNWVPKKIGNCIYMNGAPSSNANRLSIYGNLAFSSSNISVGNEAWYHDPCELFTLGHTYYFDCKLVSGTIDKGEHPERNCCFEAWPAGSNTPTWLGRADNGDKRIWECTFQPAAIAFVARNFTYTDAVIEMLIYDITEMAENPLVETVVTSMQKPQRETYGVDKFPVKSVCHAGAYGEFGSGYPENTLPGVLTAKTHGFDIVEVDVRFTSDGEAVLLHDATINRTARNTDGTSIASTINIADITLAQARTYDFGIGASTEYAGTVIPTFEEFISLCQREGIYPYVEVKAGTEAQITSLVDTVKAYHMERNVTWASFTKDYLLYIKAADEGARLGYVMNAEITSAFADIYAELKNDVNEVFLDEYHGYVTVTYEGVETEIDLLKSIGCPLEVWCPDSDIHLTRVHPYCTGYTSNWQLYKTNTIGGHGAPIPSGTGTYHMVTSVKEKPAEYDATATYAVGDFVIYNGLCYRCQNAISTPEDFTYTHWIVDPTMQSLWMPETDYYKYGGSWKGTGEGMTITKHGPLVVIDGFKNSGNRSIGLSHDAILINNTNGATPNKNIVNPSLIFKAGRTYLVTAKFISGSVKKADDDAAAARYVHFGLCRYDAANDIFYYGNTDHYFAVLTLNALTDETTGNTYGQTINMEDVEATKFVLTPEYDLQYGFALGYSPQLTFNNVTIMYELQDITDMVAAIRELLA